MTRTETPEEEKKRLSSIALVFALYAFVLLLAGGACVAIDVAPHIGSEYGPELQCVMVDGTVDSIAPYTVTGRYQHPEMELYLTVEEAEKFASYEAAYEWFAGRIGSSTKCFYDAHRNHMRQNKKPGSLAVLSVIILGLSTVCAFFAAGFLAVVDPLSHSAGPSPPPHQRPRHEAILEQLSQLLADARTTRDPPAPSQTYAQPVLDNAAHSGITYTPAHSGITYTPAHAASAPPPTNAYPAYHQLVSTTKYPPSYSDNTV